MAGLANPACAFLRALQLPENGSRQGVSSGPATGRPGTILCRCNAKGRPLGTALPVGITLASDEGHSERQGTDSKCCGEADSPFYDGHLFLLLHSIRDGFAPFPSHVQHLVSRPLNLNLYFRNRDCKFCNSSCGFGRMRSFSRATAIWTLAAARIRGQP